jgi:hypothetical protein
MIGMQPKILFDLDPRRLGQVADIPRPPMEALGPNLVVVTIGSNPRILISSKASWSAKPVASCCTLPRSRPGAGDIR